jgi:hypothetical protein
MKGVADMATLLESYNSIKEGMDTGMKSVKFSPSQIWEYQELLYRIDVLLVCQMLQKSAPESVDVKVLVPHYQMMDAYIENITSERRISADNGEIPTKLRDTAYGNLRRIVGDYRKRFGSFASGDDTGRYGKEISLVLQTVLPAWIQYRQACTEINKEETR